MREKLYHPPQDAWDHSYSRMPYYMNAFHNIWCALTHTLPGNPNNPPLRQTSSSTSVFRSTPIAPDVRTATPRGRLGLNVTSISTSPEIGGRSGAVIVMRA